MRYCLADYLEVVSPYLSSELVSEPAFAKIKAIAQKLEPTWGVLIGCKLTANTETFPVSFLVHSPHDLTEFWQTWQTETLNSTWQQAEQLCQNWMNSTSILAQTLATLCLNFDIQANQLEMPTPTICLSLPESSSPLAEDYEGLVTVLITSLPEHPHLFELRHNLMSCLACLPSNSQLLDIGVVLTDSPYKLRIQITGVEVSDFSVYLSQIAWSGSIEQLEAISFKLYPFVNRITLGLEIGRTISPTLILGCFLDQRLAGGLEWQPLLNYLLQHQLCDSAKAVALLKWAGICYEQNHLTLWPPNLTVVSQFLGSRASSVLIRDLNHLELILQPNHLTVARGYLWLGPDWTKKNN